MERASVMRLYKDRSSHETIMTLKAEESGTQFSVTVPSYGARILALEGHGLNDRCTLYNLLSECVGELGGAFGSVVVTLNRAKGVSAKIAVSSGEESPSWIKGDVIELVALAQHVQLPIYVRVKEVSEDPALSRATLPSAIEDALADILSTDAEMNSPYPVDGDLEQT